MRAEPVSVVVADDQTVVREGLRSLLALFDSLRVVAVAADGGEAVALVTELDPDVLLTDLRMPGTDGVAAIRHISHAGLRTRCVALTTYDDDTTIRDALQAGAVGFLNKDADPETIERALLAAAAGQSLLGGRALEVALGRTAPIPPEAAPPPDGITEREVEVLGLVAEGLSNQQIATRLVVSLATVKTHINHLLAKSGCRDRAGLVRYAYQRGLAG